MISPPGRSISKSAPYNTIASYTQQCCHNTLLAMSKFSPPGFWEIKRLDSRFTPIRMLHHGLWNFRRCGTTLKSASRYMHVIAIASNQIISFRWSRARGADARKLRASVRINAITRFDAEFCHENVEFIQFLYRKPSCFTQVWWYVRWSW